MTYELAQQLKDAGFPQRGLDPDWMENPNDPDEDIYCPTLSELMEACGTMFKSLSLYRNLWWAEGKEVGVIEGKTPEEAVAKLWLELKK